VIDWLLRAYIELFRCNAPVFSDHLVLLRLPFVIGEHTGTMPPAVSVLSLYVEHVMPNRPSSHGETCTATWTRRGPWVLRPWRVLKVQ